MKTVTKTQKGKLAQKLPKVKIGRSRQVAIPKKLYDSLRLVPGDYMEIKLIENHLILTPHTFIEKRLAEGLKDIKEGRSIGPFKNAREALKALNA
ncbi:AbrB/MazE/SpoVT family DNA-binding domain-containing protein [bacterium]|nr:AbrB/MazE/SpoVT family DNA-binding domain-containing protein [bacterium]MCI0566409.1 AbrB/MazE/SpoVT family DNA-binding domain-containing protein [bacterium]